MSSPNDCVEVSVEQGNPPVQNNLEETNNNNAAAKPAPSKQGKPTKASKRITGTVKWFNVKDGFGFITRHDTGEDVFLHATNILRPNSRHSVPSVGEGEVVEFGLVAAKVTGPGFKRVKGSAYVRPKSFGGRPKSGSSVRSKREEVVKKEEPTAVLQPVGDGPIVTEMADLKVEDRNEVNETAEVAESVPVEEVCVKEEVQDDDDNDDDDTVSNDSSTSTVTTAESVE